MRCLVDWFLFKIQNWYNFNEKKILALIILNIVFTKRWPITSRVGVSCTNKKCKFNFKTVVSELLEN